MDWRRNDALGELRNLSDDTICRILGNLDIQEVARLSCVSSVFYIFCNDEPLWMRLCLSSPSDKPLVYNGTWKQTALARRAEELGSAPPELRPPITFQGFSSLHLYRQWYRCHVDLRTFAFDAGHMDRRAGITSGTFAAEYDGKKPVLLTDLLGGWPASQSWTLPKLVERFGDKKFKVSQAHGKAVRMTLRDYATYTRVQVDEEPLYIFDPTFGDTAPPLLHDYTVPPLFGQDFLEFLNEELRPPFRWLVAGPPRSGAGWHVDPSLTSAWNALLGGRKRWAFYPPGKVPPGVILRMSDDGDMSFDGPPSLQWWLDIYPHIRPEDRPLECTQLPGETIFVPGGWWHCVLNIEESVAVTHNFMNEAGFETVLSDLAPGHAHRALFRAGRLAQTHLVDAPEQIPSPADIAWAHFTTPGEDYISKQALRELLRKMWAIRPDLRKRLWQCACKTVGADHWQRVLGAVSRAHGLALPGREESLPLSGGRNAIFRLGGKIVKVFVRMVHDEESDEDEEGPVGGNENGGMSEGNVLKKRNRDTVAVNGTGVSKRVRKEPGTEEECDSGAQRDPGSVANGKGVTNGQLEDGTEEDDDETPGSDQEEMFRTELLMHELIRTSGSPLSATVPALLGRGVLVEGDDASLTLDETESGEVSPTGTQGQNGTAKPASNGQANGETFHGWSCNRNGLKAGNPSNGVRVGGSLSGEHRSGGRNPATGTDGKGGPLSGKRKWMYVITAECEGTPLGDVYDQLSKSELLDVARFLGRQVGYIHALPLPPDASQTPKPSRSSDSPPPQSPPNPSKRQKTASGFKPVAIETEILSGDEVPQTTEANSRVRGCSGSGLNGHLGTTSHAHAVSNSTPDPPTGSCLHLGANPSPVASLYTGAISYPNTGSKLGATVLPTTGSPNSLNPLPGTKLPSLEALGVPLRWHPFAALLRAQRKELPERVTDLGLPAALVTSAEKFIPRDPVELLDLRTDPVWLHTDLLPDNVLVKQILLSTGKESGSNAGNGRLETGTGTSTGQENLDGERNAAGAGRAEGAEPEAQTRVVVAKCAPEETQPAGAEREGEAKNQGPGRKRGEERYEAAHILDFADARTGDPLYEIASLHIGTFRGRPELLTAFLEGSSSPANSSPGDCAPTEAPLLREFARGSHHSHSFRAVCFAVLHEINLLNLLSRHRHVAVSVSRTWEELTHALFGELDNRS